MHQNWTFYEFGSSLVWRPVGNNPHQTMAWINQWYPQARV